MRSRASFAYLSLLLPPVSVNTGQRRVSEQAGTDRLRLCLPENRVLRLYDRGRSAEARYVAWSRRRLNFSPCRDDDRKNAVWNCLVGAEGKM